LLGIGLTALSPPAQADNDKNEKYRKYGWGPPVKVYYPPYYRPPAPVYYRPPAPVYYAPPVSGYRSIPSGYRRVVIRNRVFYTRDNRTYLGYSPSRQLFVVLNPFSFF
ncbi:MAG: hypothetical protein WCD18_06090, partial [Thermosynechococcaceae cyanobacterium]